MKTEDISMLKIKHMQSKRKSYILRTLQFFFNIDFQRPKGGLTFSEKYHNFTYVSSEMYLMTKCDKSGNKNVYNYKKNYYYNGSTKCY